MTSERCETAELLEGMGAALFECVGLVDEVVIEFPHRRKRKACMIHGAWALALLPAAKVYPGSRSAIEVYRCAEAFSSWMNSRRARPPHPTEPTD